MQKITTKNYAELSQKTAEIIAECVKNKPSAVINGSWALIQPNKVVWNGADYVG